METQRNTIEDDNNIEFLLVHIEKTQNTADVRILILTKIMIGKQRLDISNKNEI